MPWIPLFDSHWESVNILIKELDQTDGLNDGLIVTIHVQWDFASWEQMGKTQSALVQINVFELLALQKLKEVSSESS